MTDGARAEIRFGMDQQLDFARLSGDTNPIHIDPIAARRLAAGQPVVYGALLTLWALDFWLESEGCGAVFLESVEGKFLRAVTVDEPIRCAVTSEADAILCALTSAGSPVAKITIQSRAQTAGARVAADLPPAPQEPPRDLDLSDLEGLGGYVPLAFDAEAAARLVPTAVINLPSWQIAALSASSRIVGVLCPGLHSIFVGLRLNFDDAPDLADLGYAVTAVDPRFRSVAMSLSGGGISGDIQAMVRQPPMAPVAAAELQCLISGAEFAGQTAVVIGGSRGLGEVTAKLLALGGATVHLTYFQGAGDAEQVVAEIRNAGGNATAYKFDVLSHGSPPDGLAAMTDPVHLYYFATPRIRRSTQAGFDEAAFGHYSDYYVSGWARVLKWLGDLSWGVHHAFYPSTVFLDDGAPSFLEYTAAKSAGEAIAAAASESLGVRAHISRLPILATDQTSGNAAAQAPGAVLIAALREFRDSGD